MSRYTIAPEAREDLKSIYRYIAERNPSAGAKKGDITDIGRLGKK